jgi:hypothetical protein
VWGDFVMTESHQERLQKIKAKHQNAYEPWSSDDDELLKTSFAAGMSVDALAKTLQRRPSAIRSRLRKFGVSISNDDQVDHHDPSPFTTSDNPINEPETTTSSLVAKSIAPLKDADPLVYSLLITKIQYGFFEKLQPKNAIYALADHIIEAISQTGGEDAY